MASITRRLTPVNAFDIAVLVASYLESDAVPHPIAKHSVRGHGWFFIRQN